MKYISLFAGIGGFDLALNRLGHECVYVNEWDKYAAQTYEKNFEKGQLENNKPRGIDGKREVGEDSERGKESIAEEKINHDETCMEGAYSEKNSIRKADEERLRSTQNKTYEKTNNTIRTEDRADKQHANGSAERQLISVDTRSITDVPTSEIPDHELLVGGFPCQSFSIAGKRRGFDDTRGTLFFDIARILADKRPRHFILENVKGLLSHDEGKTFQTILGVLSDLGYEYQWQVLNSKNFGVPQNRERVFIVGHIRGEPRPKVFPIRQDGGFPNEEQQELIQRKIQTDRYGGGQPDIDSKVLETGEDGPVYKRHPLKFLKRNQKNIEGDYAFTVDGANTGGVRQDMKIRRLTPLECERLQGFPDNWTEGVSDTQRYKQLGNAVTVNVVEEVARRL